MDGLRKRVVAGECFSIMGKKYNSNEYLVRSHFTTGIVIMDLRFSVNLSSYIDFSR